MKMNRKICNGILSAMLFTVLSAVVSTASFAQTRPFRPVRQFAKADSPGGFFGQQIAVVGDLVAISERESDIYAENGGAVHVYDSVGRRLAVFGSPNPQVDGDFGSYITAVGNDRILVGANAEDDRVGNAYLFDASGKLLQSFASPNPVPIGQFGGRFVLANDEALFIPAWGDPQFVDGEMIYSGAVCKYDHNGTLIDKFSNPRRDADGVNCLGRSGTFVGNGQMLIGDGCYDGKTEFDESGGAILFDLDGNVVQEFENPKPANLDGFGDSVASAGGRLLIGGTQIDSLSRRGGSSGAAYIYETDGTLVTRIEDPEASPGNWFGWNAGSIVRESGEEQFIVGSVFNSTRFHRAGKVFLFDTNGEVVQALESPTPGAGEQFGVSFTQYGDKLLIGETQDGGGFPNGAGAVWVFEPADFGDFDLDGDVDLIDLDTLCSDLASGDITSSLDITGDDLIDRHDLTQFLELTERLPGDADLDGNVNFDDFQTLTSNFGVRPSSWSHGNFDCSGSVGFNDFLLLSANFGKEVPRSIVAVPEPQLGAWIFVAVVMVLRRHRWAV